MEEAWDYLSDYAEAKSSERTWSAKRGLLMAADHFASAIGERTANSLEAAFAVTDLTSFEPSTPCGVLYPLTDVSPHDERLHTLVIAPTGAGKTNFLMRRCAGRRVFYTLPFQASINAMWKRFCDMMPSQRVLLQHAASRLVLKQGGARQIRGRGSSTLLSRRVGEGAHTAATCHHNLRPARLRGGDARP